MCRVGVPGRCAGSVCRVGVPGRCDSSGIKRSVVAAVLQCEMDAVVAWRRERFTSQQ